MKTKSSPLTPDGKYAGNMDRIMLLALWIKELQQESQDNQVQAQEIIAAGMGKPTFPINYHTAVTAKNYWDELLLKSFNAGAKINRAGINAMVKSKGAIDYGHPQGVLPARSKIAWALSRWYKDKVKIEAQHILFTVGGAGGLHHIFKVLNNRYPQGIIVTPFPYYTLYKGSNPQNRLFPINVMQEKGYRLTAEALDYNLQKAIQFSQKNETVVSACVLCDPNNPLGSVLGETELQKIATVFRKYPNIKIVLDEAYAEMQLDGNQHISLLQVAPDLKERIILLRSATKGCSAAGERMAAIIAFDQEIMHELVEISINNYGHAPISLQIAYAETMAHITDNRIELRSPVSFYQQQVHFIEKKLVEIGANMPDPDYKVAGTFYILVDLSELIGMKLLPATKRVLNKTGNISTDEDICYDLLFRNRIAIAPLSYYGVSPKLGALRITCSVGFDALEKLITRLKYRLIESRTIRQNELITQLNHIINEVKILCTVKAKNIKLEIHSILSNKFTGEEVLNLKSQNYNLKNILSDATVFLARNNPKEREKMAIKVQSCYRGHLDRRKARTWKNEQDRLWHQCAKQYLSSSKLQRSLLFLQPSERFEFKPWKQYLQNHFCEHDNDNELYINYKLRSQI